MVYITVVSYMARDVCKEGPHYIIAQCCGIWRLGNIDNKFIPPIKIIIV